MSSDSTPSVRVLLVEDHTDTARAMQRLLSREGYHVLTASGVGDAVRVASENTFDVVVSDIGLPDGDGCELMKQLLAMYPIKGIAVTGSGFPEDVEKCRLAGFAAHMLKPVPFDKIVAKLKELTGVAGAAE